MTNQKRGTQFSMTSLILSLLGLSLLPMMLLYPPPPMAVLPWQAQLIGIIFTIICVLGIIAGISPSHCSLARKKNQSQTKQPDQDHSSMKKTIRKEGHHPTCEAYASHVVTFKNSRYCAGCTGLVTGAIIAIIGTALFFLLNIQFIYPVVIFWFGFAFVAIGLLQHLLYTQQKVNRGIIRVIVNILFVIGSFFLLASLVQITDNLILGSYLLLLILYWIFTRIIMSRRSHHFICSRCDSLECPYSEV